MEIWFMGRLSGKIAIISGAASGMGTSHARMFVAEGAKVVLTDIAEEAGAAIAAELGENAAFIRHDVTSAADWAAAVAFTEERFGPVSVLVNNVGVSREGAITEVSEDDYNHIVTINQTSMFLGIRATVPSLRKAGGGSIVNISSAAGLVGFPNGSIYCASKFAVRGLSKALALELASDNIRVNSVHPGVIRTPMVEGLDVPAAVAPIIPLKRIGEPAEISYLVLFLASDEASYCTGGEFTADGGLTAQ